jgi:hypothetical protein
MVALAALVGAGAQQGREDAGEAEERGQQGDQMGHDRRL